MGKKSPQQFIKRQKEMERAQKARNKMAKRQAKKDGGEPENELPVTAEDNQLDPPVDPAIV
ncbi:MAG TPA: hypothetical protein VHO70_22895 [Chitinispirillaceae bacterium]|nr:hypothetical protein [Chitinispirillaceae bacterium]